MDIFYCYSFFKSFNLKNNNDICNSINDLSKKLESSLSGIQSNSSTQLFYGLIIAVVGALSAYLFNYFHWKMVEKKRKVSRVISELNTLIEGLQLTSIKYWIKDYNDDEKEEINSTEILLKSYLRLIDHYIREYNSIFRFNKKIDIIRLLEEFHIDIYDLVTGDDFESKLRVASKTRAMKISSRCSDIRAKISYLYTHI